MKCIYPDCPKRPVYYCECQIPSAYMCSEHTDYHMSSGNKYEHVCRVLLTPLTAEQMCTLETLKQNLISKRFEETKALAENHAQELRIISSVFSKRLQNTQEKFGKLIKEIDFALSSRKAEYENLIETIFNSIYYQKPYAYFVDKSCRNILKVNYLLQKQTSLKIPDQVEIGEHAYLLEISPKTIFHYGGFRHKITLFLEKGHKIPLNTCGILDLSNNTYEKLGSQESGRSMPGVVQLEDSIYIFGGVGANGQCKKLNLSLKKWKNIKSIDKSSEETSAVLCNEQVLIASNGSKNISLYNPTKDTLQTVFVCSSAAKVLLRSTKGEFYLLIGNQIFKSSETDIRTWNAVARTNVDISPQEGSFVQIDEYIHFTMLRYQHYRFNTRLLTVERLVI